MLSSLYTAALIASSALNVAAQSTHGEEGATEMGPAAFMWPPDREWGAAQDNTAPCGSSAGVTNRTDFPLINGQVALVMQDDSYYVEVSISYNDNPLSAADFTTIIDDAHPDMDEVDPGHQCYVIPDPPVGVRAGDNATLQIRYTSDFDTDRNETFYACSDIRFVEVADFSDRVPCFNASVDDFPSVPVATPSGGGSGGASSTGAAGGRTSATGGAETGASTSSGGGGGLSAGATAGVVVGSLAGAALVFGALFVLWNRHHQRKRIAQIGRDARHVAWDGGADGAARKQSSSSKGTDTSVPLQKL